MAINPNAFNERFVRLPRFAASPTTPTAPTGAGTTASQPSGARVASPINTSLAAASAASRVPNAVNVLGDSVDSGLSMAGLASILPLISSAVRASGADLGEAGNFWLGASGQIPQALAMGAADAGGFGSTFFGADAAAVPEALGGTATGLASMGPMAIAGSALGILGGLELFSGGGLTNTFTSMFTHPSNFARSRSQSDFALPDVLPTALEDLLLSGTAEGVDTVLSGINNTFPLHYDPAGQRITGGYERGLDIPVGPLREFFASGRTLPGPTLQAIKDARIAREGRMILTAYQNPHLANTFSGQTFKNLVDDMVATGRLGGGPTQRQQQMTDGFVGGLQTFERLMGTYGLEGPEAMARTALSMAEAGDPMRAVEQREGGVTPANVAAIYNVPLETAQGIAEAYWNPPPPSPVMDPWQLALADWNSGSG